NCQLNYTNQHSLHHDAWSWVSVDVPEKTEPLRPYAELLTYRDSPKYPDPLGTLGKDTTNQREPWSVHAKDPRTWWGLRRVVAHDPDAPPKPDLNLLDRLYEGPAPDGRDGLARRYAAIAAAAVEAFARDEASDDDALWLDWLLRSGLLANDPARAPGVATLVARYREVEATLRLPITMPGLADEGDGIAQPVYIRGDDQRPGDLVERGYLEALGAGPGPAFRAGSGRAALADRIADPSNPLTARVMVNRVWQWLFGRGLVATPDDFGHMGDAPTHPELLDHLTARFVADGWSVKRLVRELATSRAFQGAAAPTAEGRARDPQNRFLGRYPARRAEAEAIRDAILMAAGRLDGTMG
ncbi:MAG: DUF1553 domain-containing protein, partial [Thermoleophilia bacterium]|nr:DUF1553 domain-containing protein [Thermoleophilia bacterium]